MADSREIKTMRYMEWERVKGGINAILASYWDWNADIDSGEDLTWEQLSDMAQQFMLEFGEAAGLE